MLQREPKTYKKGDLVYVPSKAILVNFHPGVPSSRLNKFEVKEYVELQRPHNLLVVEDEGTTVLGVLYDGETWHVKMNDVYPPDEGEQHE